MYTNQAHDSTCKLLYNEYEDSIMSILRGQYCVFAPILVCLYERVRGGYFVKCVRDHWLQPLICFDQFFLLCVHQWHSSAFVPMGYTPHVQYMYLTCQHHIIVHCSQVILSNYFVVNNTYVIMHVVHVRVHICEVCCILLFLCKRIVCVCVGS